MRAHQVNWVYKGSSLTEKRGSSVKCVDAFRIALT